MKSVKKQDRKNKRWYQTEGKIYDVCCDVFFIFPLLALTFFSIGIAIIPVSSCISYEHEFNSNMEFPNNIERTAFSKKITFELISPHSSNVSLNILLFNENNRIVYDVHLNEDAQEYQIEDIILSSFEKIDVNIDGVNENDHVNFEILITIFAVNESVIRTLLMISVILALGILIGDYALLKKKVSRLC